MQVWEIVLLIILGTVAVIVAVFSAVQRIVLKRSAMAGLADIVIRIMDQHLSFDETVEMLKEQKDSGKELTVDVSKFNTKSSLKTEIVKNRKFWILNGESDSKITIVYIHGGAYIHEIIPYQWKFADKLARKTNAEVIVPDYGLAPFHTYNEAYDLFVAFYKEYTASHPNEKVYFSGDSAGGALSLGLAEYFVQNSIKLPAGLILMSPWVDVTMTNPEIKDFAPKDPMLTPENLAAAGKFWAGNADTKDWQVSPLHGNLVGLPKVLLFTGMREICYPDIKILFEKLKSADVSVEYIVGTGLNHAYTVYPIPEGKEAIAQIAAFVTMPS